MDNKNWLLETGVAAFFAAAALVALVLLLGDTLWKTLAGK